MSTPTRTVSLLNPVTELPQEFVIGRLGIFKQAAVIKEFASTVLPVLSGIKLGLNGAGSVADLLKSKLDLDLGASASGLSDALSKVDEARLKALFETLFSCVHASGQNGASHLMAGDVIDAALGYSLQNAVSLAWEVAEHNGLPFAAKVREFMGNLSSGTGSEATGTPGSDEQTGSGKPSASN